MTHMDDLEKPPLFRRWRIWYLLLLAFLLVQVIFFKLFTHTFS